MNWIKYDITEDSRVISRCITPCPYTGKFIGSLFCQLRCTAHVAQSYEAQMVQCRAAALADDKLNLTKQ